MKSLQEISAHRDNGWKGQYNRMMRWTEKFNQISIDEYQSSDKTQLYFDTMFACFQNIFFLKDWLQNDAKVCKNKLNEFINLNKDIGLCRDICNGTKHFDITRASVDNEFAIIRQFNPLSKLMKQAESEIVICADGVIYKPNKLIGDCINLWDKFIAENLNLTKTLNSNQEL